MTITRVIAAAAMLAGLAVGGAAPAWADTVFSGHYTVTETNPAGDTVTRSWDVSPCGAGCVTIHVTGGGENDTSTMHLVNGQWQSDGTDTAMVCADGTRIPAASDSHTAIDPTTLRGTVARTYKKAGCGTNAVGQTFTDTLVLTTA